MIEKTDKHFTKITFKLDNLSGIDNNEDSSGGNKSKNMEYGKEGKESQLARRIQEILNKAEKSDNTGKRYVFIIPTIFHDNDFNHNIFFI